MDGKATVALRPLRAEDRELLFRWRNDPWIVSLGSLNRTVTAEEHNAWFARIFGSDDVRIFVVQIDGKDAGQIRFVRENGSLWAVSVYLMKEFTGKGFGVEVIEQGCRILRAEYSSADFVARVLGPNEASHAAFQKAGFTKNGSMPSGETVYLSRPLP